MKRNYITFVVILLTIFSVSCDKNGVQEIDTPLTSGAQIKFFNFGVGSPSVNFYANDTKVSGTTIATGVESPTGVVFGAVFPSSTYSFIKGGAYTFKGQISSTALADPNLVVASLTASVENDKFYSLYTSGIYDASTKTTDAFIVEDKLPFVDNSTSYVRFVNGISNGTSAMELVIKETNTGAVILIGTNVPYKNASEFVKVPLGVYDIQLRYAGSSTSILTRLATSFLSGKVYSVSSRGDITVVSTTLASRPSLDNTANR